jgi:hypothetical protein
MKSITELGTTEDGFSASVRTIEPAPPEALREKQIRLHAEMVRIWNDKTLSNLKAMKAMVAMGEREGVFHNGCGPEGWKKRLTRELDKPWWLMRVCNFHPMCQMHDIRYWIGGTEQDRVNADNFLEVCMRLEVRRKLKWWRIFSLAAGLFTCEAYALLVRAAGRENFNYWEVKK